MPADSFGEQTVSMAANLYGQDGRTGFDGTDDPAGQAGHAGQRELSPPVSPSGVADPAKSTVPSSPSGSGGDPVWPAAPSLLGPSGSLSPSGLASSPDPVWSAV